MPAWSPQAWDSLGAGGLMVFMGTLFIVSLLRGWLVLGKTHREIVDRLDGRAETDAETIEKLSTAVTEKNATAEATCVILSSLRESLTAAAGDTS